MKRNTPDHPKTHHLKELLQVELPFAVGTLELLWHFTGKFAPQGDVGKWTDAQIAERLGWSRDPAQLVRGLLDARFLDDDPEHRLLVHDWEDHADDTTKKWLSRHKLKILKPSRRCRDRVPTESRVCPDSVTPAVAVAGAVAVAEPEPMNAPPGPPLAGGPADDEPGEVTPIDRGEVLVAVEMLAAEFIAAGGVAARPWRTWAKGELRARGVTAGSEVVRDVIARQRASTAAERERRLVVSATAALVTRARSSGRGREEWAAVALELESRIQAHSFGTWFRPLVPLGIVEDDEGERLLLEAPNEQFSTWIGRNYQELLGEAAAAAGFPGLAVLVVDAARDTRSAV